jgi:hypothetical protein
MLLRRYGNGDMSSINGAETIFEEWIVSRIVLDFRMHLTRIGRPNEMVRRSGNDIVEEMIDVSMKSIIAMPKGHS